MKPHSDGDTVDFASATIKVKLAKAAILS